jgi:hypothetical protein
MTRFQFSSTPRLTAPFSLACQGCDGTGHLGRRVEPAHGPCELCWGTGRAFYVFDLDDMPSAPNIPIAAAVHVGLTHRQAERVTP